MAMRRIEKELEISCSPDLGILTQKSITLRNDANDLILGHYDAALASWKPLGMPCMLRLEIPRNYPYHPVKVRFLSNVPHPLIGSDGSIALDILGREWSPGMQIRSVLIAIQQVLNEPSDKENVHAKCIRNPDWESGSISTARADSQRMFHMFLQEARSALESFGRVKGYNSWHAIRALRHILNETPLLCMKWREEWYDMLQCLSLQYCAFDLSQAFSQLSQDSVSSAAEVAIQQWISEARLLLALDFRLDGVKLILCAPALCRGLGDLGFFRMRHFLLRMILSYVVHVPELVACNDFLARIAQ